MEVRPTRRFIRDISRIQDTVVLRRVDEAISALETAASLRDVPGILKLSGFDQDYRIRIGDYRLGFSLEEGVVILYRLLHRRDFYRYFP